MTVRQTLMSAAAALAATGAMTGAAASTSAQERPESEPAVPGMQQMHQLMNDGTR